METSQQHNKPYVLLVEPGLHSPDGHMRGELEALASGMRSINVNFSVVGWKAPRVPLPDWLRADFVNSRLQGIIEALPPRIGVRLLEFQVYRTAFIAGRQRRNTVIIGLTASGPFGQALAALSISKLPASILITRHTGSATQSRNSPWRYSFDVLAKRGCGLGAYSTAVAARLQTTLPKHGLLVRHLPEVIADTPATTPKTRAGLDEVLLISGLDSIGRRAPVRHLLGMDSIRFKKVVLHDPSGKFIGCDELQRRHDSSVIFQRVSTYFTTEFTAFLGKASAVLVAYEPSFINPSSILRHLLAAGIPAISSRFPDSDFLVNRFGSIGELWNFDDIASLNDAISRFMKWRESDFLALAKASRALLSWANPSASASAHVRFAMEIREMGMAGKSR